MYLRERAAGISPTSPAGSRPDASPNAPVLLLIHGLGESGLCFEHLLDHPGTHPWHLLIPDLPGYGRSPAPDRPPTLAGQADHLAAWLHSTGRGPLVVVGHSMGGVTGLLLCERHPHLAAALINVDGNLSLADCVYSGQAVDQNLDEFQRQGFTDLREAIYRSGQNDPAQRGYYVSLRLCGATQFHLNSTELVEMSRREDLVTRLVNLPLPHLYLAGVPGGISLRSRHLLARARANWLAIEPSGHWPFIDQPAAFVSRVDEFLSKLG